MGVVKYSVTPLLPRDTPDTIISSSSPECGFAEKETDFSSLRPIDPASPGSTVDDKYSPTVPLLHPIPTYPSARMEAGDRVDIKPPQPPVSVLPPPPPPLTPTLVSHIASLCGLCGGCVCVVCHVSFCVCVQLFFCECHSCASPFTLSLSVCLSVSLSLSLFSLFFLLCFCLFATDGSILLAFDAGLTDSVYLFSLKDVVLTMWVCITSLWYWVNWQSVSVAP